jgi:MFS transporter, AAHS family, 4-hydroxybenzoate transporter
VSDEALGGLEKGGFDVHRFLEGQALGRSHLLLTALGVLAVGMDGLDAQAIGYVAPEISRAWGLPRSALGVVFSTSLLGMMIGAMIFGVLGDRLGRKRVIVSCVLLIGLATLATTQAGSVESLVLCRLIVGTGIGGVGPNIYALLSEYSPARRRATLIMIVTTSFPLGAALGGIIATHIVPQLGWQSMFWMAGISTVTLVPVLLLWLPDSVRQMILTGASAERSREALLRFAPHLQIAEGTPLLVRETPAQGFPVWELFRNRRAAMTTLLWGMYFVTMLVNYFVSNWLPTVGHDAGLSLQSALQATSLFQFGGVAGAIGFGLLIDRRQPRIAMTVAFAGAGPCMLALGFGWSSQLVIAVSAFGAGFCINGTQIGDTFIASVSYPTALRSTGVGWSAAVGRIGATCGPLVGGLLLTGGWDRSAMFIVAAVLSVLIAIAVFLLGPGVFAVMGASVNRVDCTRLAGPA